MGNQTGEWVNLYGSDGKVKARLNRDTLELVVKERGVYHSWRLAAMVKLGQNADAATVESVPVSC